MTRDELRARLAAALNMPADKIRDDSDLPDLGLDSLAMMTLLTEWDAAGHDFDMARFAEERSFAGWWDIVRGQDG